MSQNTTGTTPETPEPAKLYVVLHGELAINEEEGSDWIRVFAGYMPQHVYMAGPWFGERHIQKDATLVLTGVVTGEDSVAKHRDEMLIYQGGQCDSSMSCMEVILPRPSNILTVKAADFAKGDVKIYGPQGVGPLPPDGQSCSPQLGLCHVFVYDVDPDGFDGNHPNHIPYLTMTDSMRMSGELPAGTGAGWMSLHIFAEADMEVLPAHVSSALRMSAGILGIDIVATATPNVDRDAPCPPLPWAQTHLTLSERLDNPACQDAAWVPPVSLRPLVGPSNAVKTKLADSPNACGPGTNLVFKHKPTA